MKNSAKLVLAALALASCAAGAETVYSGQADQERRDRNREEALANYRAHAKTDRQSADSKVQRAENSTKHAAHEVAAVDPPRVARSGRVDPARDAQDGQRGAPCRSQDGEEARDITARADAKFGAVQHGKAESARASTPST